MTIITVEPPRTGLNNQRMCLLGLIGLAQDSGARALVPSHLVDYAPAPKKPGEKIVPMDDVPTWEVINEASFRDYTRDLPVVFDQPADQVLTMQTCFTRGTAELRKRDASTAAYLRGTAAAAPLAEHARAINEFLSTFGTVTALQLRIERDWREYLLRRFGQETITESEHLTADPKTILSKVVDSGLPTTVWACCDETDLVESTDELKQIGKELGVRLLFKSDLPPELAYPERRILQSVIDFAVALAAPVYVGLTRSTFSNAIALHRRLGLITGDQYVYNAPSPLVQPARLATP